MGRHYELMGGICDLNGWGIYGLMGAWGSYGKVSYCFFFWGGGGGIYY